MTATIDIGRHLDLTLEFSDGRLTGTDLGFGASHPRGDDKDDGLGGSGIASPQPSSVTPLQSTLFTYTLTYSGTHVQGTSGADLITVGTADETVNAGGGPDVIVYNPLSISVIGGPQMVILDGGAGADTYRLTADPGAPADLPGC